MREQRRKRQFEHQKALQLQQKMELEKSQARLQAEDEERKRIAQEIHDDISPTITTLSIAAHTISLSDQKDVVEKTTKIIVRMTKQINEQLSEIIWSLNSAADELLHLNAFVRKFAEGFLSDVGIILKYESNIALDESKVVGYKRRAIYHCVKEILNNSVKYAQSNSIEMSLIKEKETLNISIRDFGKGLTNNEVKGSGNGMQNIQKNIQKIGGTISLINDNGLTTILSIPLETSN